MVHTEKSQQCLVRQLPQGGNCLSLGKDKKGLLFLEEKTGQI